MQLLHPQKVMAAAEPGRAMPCVLTLAALGVPLPEGSLLQVAALPEQSMAAPVVLHCQCFCQRAAAPWVPGLLRCSASFRRAPST